MYHYFISSPRTSCIGAIWFLNCLAIEKPQNRKKFSYCVFNTNHIILYFANYSGTLRQNCVALEVGVPEGKTNKSFIINCISMLSLKPYLLHNTGGVRSGGDRLGAL